MDEPQPIPASWEHAIARDPDGAPIAIGIPQGIWAGAWAHPLADHPEVDLCVEDVHDLGVALGSGALSCALVPVEIAVRVERGRVIPGLGVCVRGAGAGPWFAGEHGPMDGWGSGLARVISGEEDRAMEGLIAFGDAPDSRDESKWTDLSGAWLMQTKLPWVAAVWVCVVGAPVPKLRRILGIASRDLAQPDRLAELYPEASPAWIADQHEKSVYFSLGEEEMSSLRLFLEHGVRHRVVAEDARITLC